LVIAEGVPGTALAGNSNYTARTPSSSAQFRPPCQPCIVKKHTVQNKRHAAARLLQRRRDDITYKSMALQDHTR
jgi:hypothetical protein